MIVPEDVERVVVELVKGDAQVAADLAQVVVLEPAREAAAVVLAPVPEAVSIPVQPLRPSADQYPYSCTAQDQAELIAHLGENIVVGNPIKATEYLQLKTAIDAEYTRRGKSAPESFVKVPAAKELVLLSISQKILTDIYAFDSLPEHDWRNVFESGNVVSPSKWQPAILYLKDLSTQIVP